MGADFALRAPLRVEADEHHPCAGISRMQCQCDWKTGMDADACYGRTRPKRGLSARLHDSFRNPLGDRTRTTRTPVRHRYSLSADLLLCGKPDEVVRPRSPARALPRKPFVSPSLQRRKA